MFNEAAGGFGGDDGVVSGIRDAALTPGSDSNVGASASRALAADRDGVGFVSPTQQAVAILAEIDRLLDGLPVGLEGVEALESGVFAQARRASDRMQTVLALAAASVDAGGGWRVDGSRSCAGHVSREHQISYGRADQLCRTGALLRDVLPATAVGLQAGAVGWDIAVDMVKHTTTSPARREALNTLVEVEDKSDLGNSASRESNDLDNTPRIRGEEWLLAQSHRMTEKQFRMLVRNWSHRADPEADERGFKAAAEREHVVLVETMDCFHLEGVLTIEHGKILQTALKAVIGVPSTGDSRSGAQRMAHALVDLARVNLEQHLQATTSGARPHLTITVPYETFRTLAENAGEDGDQLDALAGTDPGTWTNDTGPIPNSLLARLACDSAVTRVVFGPTGEVINAGRSRRIISVAARAAVIARDKHCVYPRCDAPPGLSEIHHVHHWSHGGRTDLNNLALICWRHHQHLHATGLTITRANAQWHFTTPDGKPIQ